MAPPNSIDRETGERLLEACQELGSLRKAAAKLGIPYGTAQRFIKKVPTAGAAVVAAEAVASPKPVTKTNRKATAKEEQQQTIADAGVALLTTAHKQLVKNLNRIEALITQMDVEVEAAEDRALTLFDSKSLAVYLKAIEASTAHVTKAEESFRLLIDTKEVKRFLQVIIDAIAEEEPQVRDRIIARLEAEHAHALVLLS